MSTGRARARTPEKRHPEPRLGAIPQDWSFRRADVARAFDSHVREQLPWYDLATGVVAHVARHYLPPDGTVIDVGASTGNVSRAIADTVRLRSARLIAFDASADMVAQYRGPVACQCADVRAFDFAAAAPDLIIAFLVLMFVPVADRAAVIERMTASLRPGGALLLVDKMQPAPGYAGTVLYRLTLAAKYEAGAPPAEVIAKELSLAGYQRPLQRDEVAGFAPVFRFGDFAGFLYERI